MVSKQKPAGLLSAYDKRTAGAAPCSNSPALYIIWAMKRDVERFNMSDPH